MPLIMMLGLPEMIVLGLIVILIFGAKKIPQIGAGLGQGIRNFKDSLSGKDEDKKIASGKSQDED